jgi:hypothetical protein
MRGDSRIGADVLENAVTLVMKEKGWLRIEEPGNTVETTLECFISTEWIF